MAEAILSLKSFAKGINQAIDKQLISISGEVDAAEAQNMDISSGNLSSVNGCSTYTTAVLNQAGNLMDYYNGSAKVLVAVGYNTTTSKYDVYKLNGSTYSSFATGFSNGTFDYVNYQSGVNQIMIFGNGTENMKVYDGVTLRDLKNDGASSTAGSTNVAPKGKYLELHKERLFIANGNRLYFSTAYDPDDWTAPVTAEESNQHGGFIDIPTWDSGTIIGLKSLFDYLYIFKNKQVFSLYGTYPGNFTLTQIFNSTNGEIVDKTIQSLDNRAYWLTNEGIYAFNGATPINLAPRIKKEFAKINQAAVKSSVAAMYKGKYYLAVPTGSATVPDMVIEYDTVNDAFMIRRGMTIKSMIVFDDKLLYADNAGKVLQYNSGTTYNGTAISSYFLTGDLYADRLDKYKSLNQVHLIASGSGTIRISAISEKKTVYKDIVLTSSEKPYKIRMRNKGKIMSFKFENVSGATFTIKQPQINLLIQD